MGGGKFVCFLDVEEIFVWLGKRTRIRINSSYSQAHKTFWGKWSLHWKPAVDGSIQSTLHTKSLTVTQAAIISGTDGLKCVWNKNVPLKIASFSWRLLQDKIPTIINLWRRSAYNPNFSTKCVLCGKNDESSEHLFFLSEFAAAVWEEWYSWFGCSTAAAGTMMIHFENHSSLKPRKSSEIWTECGIAQSGTFGFLETQSYSEGSNLHLRK